jgi:hypothetical protein
VKDNVTRRCVDLHGVLLSSVTGEPVFSAECEQAFTYVPIGYYVVPYYIVPYYLVPSKRRFVMTTRRNPFDYGGPVTGDQFAGRKREVAGVVERLTDHIGVVVTAPRRYGKSSLINQACVDLESRKPTPAVVTTSCTTQLRSR